MPTYTWKNTKTGEIVDVERPMSDYNVPPNGADLDSGEWERVLSFAVKVAGGTTPARGSTSYGRKK